MTSKPKPVGIVARTVPNFPLMPPPADLSVDAPAPARLEPNAIDMRRAAGVGTLPRNDVRRQEQTDNALHQGR